MKIHLANIRQHIAWIAGGLVIGLLAGWIFFHSGGKGTQQSIAGHEHGEAESAVWTCSMHPQVRQDKPGKCPICGMDLVPLSNLESSTSGAGPDEVIMSESAARLADIQTVRVTRGTPVRDLYLQGKVEPDERNIAELTARFGGRLEKLYVNFTGQNVSRGEKLATIYSPDLVSAQKELLEAVAYKDSRPALYNAARTKLKLWDLSDQQITEILEKGEPRMYFDVLSPISGTVMMRHVSLGDYVKEGSALFQIIDLTRIWVMLDAYESDLPWIREGDRANFTVSSLPGESFSGRVSYIDPFIHDKTRVAGVRIEVDNPGLRLKPGIFVNGRLHSEIAGEKNRILVPRSAVLWTGERAVVYVKVPGRASPTFLYREIVLGPEAGNFYVVSDGLKEGEEIAVNGVFRIDAAAQLAGLPSMMNPEGGTAPAGHDHMSMDMGSGTGPSTRPDAGRGESEGPGTSKAGRTEDNIAEAGKSETGNPGVSDDFRNQLQRVYKAYLPMKDAFVASDAEGVSRNAGDVKSRLEAVNMELLKGDVHMQWMSQLDALKPAVDEILAGRDIEEQRTSFAAFNAAFYNTLKTFGLEHGTVYYQYCPMAIGNQGAFWLSSTGEIRNPYFGQAMLSCGETRDTLDF